MRRPTGAWVLTGLVLAAACGNSTAANPSLVHVVAGQGFWGGIASQLGGSKVKVQSVVTDPNADPHLYESSANDARAFAEADLVILNGAGYDVWAQKLLDANATSHRQVVNVAQLLGKKTGDNPHFWYSPAYVHQVADKLTAEYKSIDSSDSAFFDQQSADFYTALKPYFARIAEIKQKFAGVRVGSTESIFGYMADALGLNLISPVEFMNAVSEGNDPPAGAVIEFQNQISTKQIKALVYNVQTATAVTTNVRRLAAQQDIPVVGVSETLQPETVTFQDWQLAQLITLENALNSDALTR